MLEPLYIAGNSRLHRLPAGLKLLALCAAGRGCSRCAIRAGWAWRWPWPPGWSGPAAPGLRCSGANYAAWRGFCWRWGCSPAFQGGVEALAVLLRVGAMVGLALAVTLTTRTADLIAVCEWALLPLQRLGLLDAGKVALALALALRFVPEIWRNFHEIREAQAARGLGANPLALIVPLIVLTLKRAQEVSEAIDARSP